jgi:hypothetical protein
MTRAIGERVQYAGEDYVSVKTPFGMMKEHEWVAQQAIGRPLRDQERVHHFNKDKADNRSANLVICEDERYHKLLHQRQESMDATGDPSMRKCRFCEEWDCPDNLYIPPSGWSPCHRTCYNSWQRERRALVGRSDRPDPADAILSHEDTEGEGE